MYFFMGHKQPSHVCFTVEDASLGTIESHCQIALGWQKTTLSPSGHVEEPPKVGSARKGVKGRPIALGTVYVLLRVEQVNAYPQLLSQQAGSSSTLAAKCREPNSASAVTLVVCFSLSGWYL